jgi:CheY-like chemotaxis protein
VKGKDTFMKKILIVDDVKNIRMLLTRCLEIEGYDVYTSDNGTDALELIQNNKYDLIFLDIKLPEVKGTEILRRIREMGIKTPVIIITAFASIKNTFECAQLGAVAYMQKPFTGDKIKSVLNELKIKFFSDEDKILCSLEENLKNVTDLIEKLQFNEAYNLLRNIMSQEPDNAQVYFLFSKVYEGMGDKEKAQKFYESYKLFSKMD